MLQVLLISYGLLLISQSIPSMLLAQPVSYMYTISVINRVEHASHVSWTRFIGTHALVYAFFVKWFPSKVDIDVEIYVLAKLLCRMGSYEKAKRFVTIGHMLNLLVAIAVFYNDLPSPPSLPPPNVTETSSYFLND